jgi:RNA polymerase sigma-70 factor, ECF subfamily
MNARLQLLEAKLHSHWTVALDGDTHQYTLLLQELAFHLRHFLKKRLHHTPAQDIEDIIQEVLLAVHQKRYAYQSHQPFTAWVYAIARYKLIDHLRRLSRQDFLHDELPDWENELWAYDPNESNDDKGMLNQMLAELPDKQRLPIEHTKLEGLSIAETAQRTGQTLASVKVNIHRGLKDLKEMAQKKYKGDTHEYR